MKQVSTKAEFKAALLKEGNTYKYSGKTKTIYLSKNPSGNLLIDIEKAGFNVKIQNTY